MRFVTRITLLATLFLSPLTVLGAAQSYTFDKNHSHLQFGIQHLGISTFLGQFQTFRWQRNLRPG